MAPSLIVTIVIGLLAIALIVAGFKILKGTLKVPEDKKEQIAVASIGIALLLGLTSLVFVFNPAWTRTMQAKILQRQPTK